MQRTVLGQISDDDIPETIEINMDVLALKMMEGFYGVEPMPGASDAIVEVAAKNALLSLDEGMRARWQKSASKAVHYILSTSFGYKRPN
jgi:hypothetical protein